MLNIYIGKEYIPEDKILIYDVEDYFGTVRIKDSLTNREIIEKIESYSESDLLSNVHNTSVAFLLSCKKIAPPRPVALQSVNVAL